MLAYETNSRCFRCASLQRTEAAASAAPGEYLFWRADPPEGLGIKEPTAMDYRRASRLVMDKIQELRDQDEAWFHRK